MNWLSRSEYHNKISHVNFEIYLQILIDSTGKPQHFLLASMSEIFPSYMRWIRNTLLFASETENRKTASISDKPIRFWTFSNRPFRLTKWLSNGLLLFPYNFATSIAVNRIGSCIKWEWLVIHLYDVHKEVTGQKTNNLTVG